MDLIDRYLHAVRRNLPPAKADDIVAELRDDLFSQKEAREESLDRDLSKDEVSALLKENGHPLLVASRFRKHQYLIGPEIFPFYLSVMRVVLMIVVGLMLIVSTTKAILAGADMLTIWASTMAGIFSAVLWNAALVTAIFAVVERTGIAAAPLVNWIPDELPKVVDKQKGPWESAFEVAASVAFLLWWTGVIHLPFTTVDADFRLEPSPIFTELFWPILILSIVRLVYTLIQWLRPNWKTLGGVLNIGTAVAGLVLLAIVYQSGGWVTVISQGMAAEQVGKLQESLDLSFRITTIVIAVVWTLGILGAGWRLVRGRG